MPPASKEIRELFAAASNAGVSTPELARAAGVNRSTVYRWREGKGEPKRNQYWAMAATLVGRPTKKARLTRPQRKE